MDALRRLEKSLDVKPAAGARGKARPHVSTADAPLPSDQVSPGKPHVPDHLVQLHLPLPKVDYHPRPQLPPPTQPPAAPPEPVEGFYLAPGTTASSTAPQPSTSLLSWDGWQVAGAEQPSTAAVDASAGISYVPYPGRQPVPPSALPREFVRSSDWKLGAHQAHVDLRHSPRSEKSVWDVAYLQENHDLAQCLHAFQVGRVGVSVKTLIVKDKSPEALHDELLQRGFAHQREPLKAGLDPSTGQPLFGCRDGSRTADPRDPNLVPQDIYVHPDGGMVRVKPEGVPGNKFRPEPHVSKSVLLKAAGPQFRPSDGADFANEAFKVTDKGVPVPKATTVDAGLKMAAQLSLFPERDQGYRDTLMSLAHINIPLTRL